MSVGDTIKNEILKSLTKREEIEHEIEQHEHGDFNARMRLFAKLENWKRELEAALKFCKAEAEKLSPLLIEEMADNGIQNMRVEGLSIHTRSDFYCSKKADKDGATTDVICAVLKDLGLGHIVSEGYAASALKARVKEWLENEVEIPPELSTLINYGEQVRLVSSK